MKKTIVSLCAAGLLFFTLWSMNTLFFPLLLTLLACMAVYEVEKAVDLKNMPAMALSVVVAGSMPIIIHCKEYLSGYFKYIPNALLLYFVLMMIFMLAFYEKTKFYQIAVGVFSSLFFPACFTIFILLRDMGGEIAAKSDKSGAVFLILWPSFAAWGADAFAQVTGMIFGKHKLAPKISPNKTIEGAVGGIAVATAMGVILLAVFNRFFFTGAVVPYWIMLVFTPVLSVTGILGDLAASAIKRNAGIKDFSKMLPATGGIMDKVDSATFTFSVYYCFLPLILKV
ncbi:MAG: phosphatidate cytidylyltransferase [Oscillospiraceae bacterium]|nr:phosphatidate cytidylyltransferase [Oscillospiraceae bacterium]